MPNLYIAKNFQMDGGVDGGAVAHIIYSLCTANDLQSRIHYFIVACVEFSGEWRDGRWCGRLYETFIMHR